MAKVKASWKTAPLGERSSSLFPSPLSSVAGSKAPRQFPYTLQSRNPEELIPGHEQLWRIQHDHGSKDSPKGFWEMRSASPGFTDVWAGDMDIAQW